MFQLDLAGDYYDAADNVKFSFDGFLNNSAGMEMLEFGHLMSSEHEHALMGYMLFPEGHECPWKSCCFSW